MTIKFPIIQMNKGVAEDCVHLRNDGYWNDAYCADDYMGYVCQISRMYSNCVSKSFL